VDSAASLDRLGAEATCLSSYAQEELSGNFSARCSTIGSMKRALIRGLGIWEPVCRKSQTPATRVRNAGDALALLLRWCLAEGELDPVLFAIIDREVSDRRQGLAVVRFEFHVVFGWRVFGRAILR